MVKQLILWATYLWECQRFTRRMHILFPDSLLDNCLFAYVRSCRWWSRLRRWVRVALQKAPRINVPDSGLVIDRLVCEGQYLWKLLQSAHRSSKGPTHLKSPSPHINPYLQLWSSTLLNARFSGFIFFLFYLLFSPYFMELYVCTNLIIFRF